MQTAARLAPALLLAIALPAAANAQEATAADAASAGPALSGFVEGGALLPLDGFPAGSRGIAFGLGQAELDARFAPDPELEVGLDLNFFPNAPAATDDGLLEQGFVTWSPAETEGLSLTIGKQNAPIGLESLDPVDLATVSGGLVWSYGVPSNLTGLFVKQAFASGSAQLFTTAEWDSPSSAGAALLGGRVDLAEGPWAVGLVATHGPLPESGDPARTMANLTASYALGDLSLSGEYLYAKVGKEEANGWTVLATQTVNDRCSITARIDRLKKDYGDTAIDQADVTLVAGYRPTPHLRTLLEAKQAAVGDDNAATSLALGIDATF